MDATEILLLILVGMGGGFVQRVSGFGLGIFTMMFLPHFMPTHTAAATISTLFSCCTSLYNTLCNRKSISFKTALPMLCAALISIPVAVYFSTRISGRFFEMLLGGALILLSLYFFFFSKRIKIRPTAPNGILAGALGGVLGGLFSTGGPPAVVYLSHATPDNKTYFATIQFYFCITNIYAALSRAVNGAVNKQILFLAAVGVVGCMLGNFIGKLVFDKLNSKKLKIIIYTGMIISGILLFL